MKARKYNAAKSLEEIQEKEEFKKVLEAQRKTGKIPEGPTAYELHVIEQENRIIELRLARAREGKKIVAKKKRKLVYPHYKFSEGALDDL